MKNVSGQILVYRVFDIGPDFDLVKIEKHLSNLIATQRTKLTRPTRSLQIANAPLAFQMGQCRLLSDQYQADIQIKIWPFGAISIIYCLSIEDIEWVDLINLGTLLESDDSITDFAAEKARQVLKMIDAKREPELGVIEDYMIYFFTSLPDCNDDAIKSLEKYDVPKLLMTENTAELSLSLQKMIKESVIQYNKNDLVAITWNSAIVIEPTGHLDVAEIIEFALCQVLEMRYYDYLLEKKLSALYDSLDDNSFNLFKNRSERLSKEAAKHYLEISETVENVENSLKVIGDFYLAQTFRTASQRFRFNDWRESVDQKLRNLADISQLMNNNVNAHRSHLLEVVIIVLIAIEVVPFLVGLLK